MFGNVVLGLKGLLFEECIDSVKKQEGVKLDVELTAAALRRLVGMFKVDAC